MKKGKFGTFLLVAGMAALTLTSCVEKSHSDTMGTLKLSVTDAPFPIEYIEEANITVTKIELRMVSDTTDSVFKTVMEDSVSFNLMDLRNGITQDLSEVDIEPGTYDLVRIFVSEASLTLVNGSTFDMKVPSGSSSGIKVFVDPAIEVSGGLTSELLLDFNLEKSFVLKGSLDSPGGIRGFNFKPVIRAVNNSTAGTVQGVVSDTTGYLIPGATVWVKGDTVVSSAITDSAGFYAVPGILAGYWTIGVSADGYQELSEDTYIPAANRVTVDFVLTPEAE